MACRTPPAAEPAKPEPTSPAPTEPAVVEPTTPPQAQCGGSELRVAFYDAGQALAALVTLPDGQRILVDAGESPTRAGCGKPCKEWHARVLAGLERDIGVGGKIDMVWNTHPHSDHLGGMPGVAAKFEVGSYVHNGRELTGSTVKKAIDAAHDDGARVVVVEPGSASIPLSTSEDVKLTAIVPDQWSSVCKANPNECSILLRVDYCDSSILFTGDAEHEEEQHIDIGGEVDLLQVGHHGSSTSTTLEFIAKAKPRYAVISSGRQGEGTNRTYCHPIRSTVDTLNDALGGPGSATVRAFDGAASGVKCNKSKPSHWVDAPASDQLWVTARDGDIILTTTGDGVFTRSPSQ